MPNLTYFFNSVAHFVFKYFKNILHVTYNSFSHSLLSILDVSFALHTLSISFSHTLTAGVSCGNVVTLSDLCILLLSLLL